MGVNTNEASPSTAEGDHHAAGSATAVKYRLVEAEEVDTSPKSTAAGPRAAKPKKKGKLNWSQFMEGDEFDRQSDESSTSVGAGAAAASAAAAASTSNGHHHEDSRSRGPRGRGGRFGGRGGRFNGRRPYYDDNGVYYNGVYVPNPDTTVTAQWARNQIEFYFTPDNLVRDIFLRQHMDVDGYVPLAFVGSFQAVFSMHQDYPSLLATMKESEFLELDETNEKIRLRNGWQQWLWPNAEGSYGVPRYVKVAEDAESEEAK